MREVLALQSLQSQLAALKEQFVGCWLWYLYYCIIWVILDTSTTGSLLLVATSLSSNQKSRITAYKFTYTIFRLDYTEVNLSSDSLCSLRSQLREPVAPYTPVFLDGWKPEALRPDGQVWEDPVESQHKNEDLRVKQEVWNACVRHSLDIYSTVCQKKRSC